MTQPMNPDDIPTAITRETYRITRSLIEAGVPVLSQNDTAKFLAHYWPAIEQHIRQQVAEQIDAEIDRDYETRSAANGTAYRAGLSFTRRLLAGRRPCECCVATPSTPATS